MGYSQLPNCELYFDNAQNTVEGISTWVDGDGYNCLKLATIPTLTGQGFTAVYYQYAGESREFYVYQKVKVVSRMVMSFTGMSWVTDSRTTNDDKVWVKKDCSKFIVSNYYNHGRDVTFDHQISKEKYKQKIQLLERATRQVIMSSEGGSSSSRSSSGNSSHSSSSRSSCYRCHGTGVDPTPNTGGSNTSWVAYYNTSGTKCPYCSYYSSHFHNRCAHCNVPSR